MPTGPLFGQAYGTGTPPAFTGGTIVSGTYNVTAQTLYGNCPPLEPAQLQETSVITATSGGGSIEAVAGVGGQTESGCSTYTVSGTSITTTNVCGGSGPPSTDSYTATSNSLLLGVPVTSPDGGACTEVTSFSLQ
jgi:hypothetical protein